MLHLYFIHVETRSVIGRKCAVISCCIICFSNKCSLPLSLISGYYFIKWLLSEKILIKRLCEMFRKKFALDLKLETAIT